MESSTLLNRIKNSTKRPLTVNKTNNDLKKMIKKRTKYYSKALYKVNCDNQTKKEIVDKILDVYENY